MTDAERLRTMHALLNEVAYSSSGQTSENWRMYAHLACVDYRTSRPDTRTGLGVAPDAVNENEDDDGPSCGCSDESGPCDRHNGMNEDDGPNQHAMDQSLRDSGRGHLVRP